MLYTSIIKNYLLFSGFCKGQNTYNFQKQPDLKDPDGKTQTRPQFISKSSFFSVEQGSYVTFPCEAKNVGKYKIIFVVLCFLG